MKTWCEVDRLHGQYMMTVQAFKDAREEAAEITAAVWARINRDREADKERLAELAEITASGGAAARMAAIERDGLTLRTYGPTVAEKAAFDEVITRAAEAAAELVPLRGDFTGACKAASEELDEMRKQVTGDQSAELRVRWIEGDRQEFEALGSE